MSGSIEALMKIEGDDHDTDFHFSFREKVSGDDFIKAMRQ